MLPVMIRACLRSLNAERRIACRLDPEFGSRSRQGR